MDSSAIYLKTLKELEREKPSEKKRIEVIYREGLFFLSKSERKKAITSFFEASKLAEKTGDHIGYVKSTTAIGRILYINKDYSKALEYFMKSIKRSKERELPSYEGNARALKGITELALGDLESSIKEFQIAENLLTSKIDLLMLEIMKMNYYLEKGDQTKVNSMALSILAEMNTMELSGTLGDVSKLTKRISSSTDEEVLDHLNSIEKNIKVNFKQDGQLEAYIKARALMAKQDKKKGDEIIELKKLIKIKDSTYSLEKEKIITELEIKYETEKKKKEVLKLNEEKAQKELVITKEKKKKQGYASIAGLTLIILFFFIYYAYNRKRKIEQNNKLKLVQVEYKNKLALITTKQKVHNEIGIELHDVKAKDLERIAIQLENKGEITIASDVNQIKDTIRHLSSELRSISFEESSFIDQLITLGTDYSNDARKIKLQGIKSIDWSLISDTVKRNLFLVIREGVSNAVMHGKASIVNVVCKNTSNHIEVSIIDNGTGFDLKQSVSGIGMRNMKMRIKELDGTIQFQSMPQKGTSVYITIVAA